MISTINLPQKQMYQFWNLKLSPLSSKVTALVNAVLKILFGFPFSLFKLASVNLLKMTAFLTLATCCSWLGQIRCLWEYTLIWHLYLIDLDNTLLVIPVPAQGSKRRVHSRNEDGQQQYTGRVWCLVYAYMVVWAPKKAEKMAPTQLLHKQPELFVWGKIEQGLPVVYTKFWPCHLNIWTRQHFSNLSNFSELKECQLVWSSAAHLVQGSTCFVL